MDFEIILTERLEIVTFMRVFKAVEVVAGRICRYKTRQSG